MRRNRSSKNNIQTPPSDNDHSAKSAVYSTEQSFPHHEKLKRSEATCDPSLFLALPAEKPLSERTLSSEAKGVCDPSLFMALSGASISASNPEKDLMPGSWSDQLTPRQQFSDSISSFLSIEDEDQHQLVSKCGLNFQSENRSPVGPADFTKETVQVYESSLEPEEELERCAESLISSLSRHGPDNAQLYSIGSGSVRPTIINKNLLIVDLMPRYARNEKILLPKDSAPPKNCNNFDKYGYLNTSLQEIQVVPQPLYTIGRDNQTPELINFDELPLQNGIWTTRDQWEEASSTYHEFGEPIAAKQVTEQLPLDPCSKLQRHNIEGPINPYSVPIKDRETVANYVKTVEKVDLNYDQIAMIEKLKRKGIEKRTRRKLEEGSYSNFSVDEKKLFGRKDKILRFTWKGKLLKLRKLLEDTKSHADINRQDYCGRTALHYAASWNCPQTMKLLLSVPGVDVNLQDADGKTALRKACEIKSMSCVKLLVQYGADMCIVGTDGRNPFEYVLQELGDAGLELALYLYNDAQMCNEKRERGIVSHLHQLCLAKVKVVKLAEELIRSGAAINATEGSGKTPLILASKMNSPDLVKLFLAYKADVMHVDLENYKNALEYTIPGEACYKIIKKEMMIQLQEYKKRTANSSIKQVSPAHRRI